MTPQKPRVLVFDDDSSYIRLLKRHAEAMDVETITCATMEEYCLAAIDGNFEVALIDYHLEHFKGPTVAVVIEERPVIMMSSDKNILSTAYSWPSQIVEIVDKGRGPAKVLRSALKHAA
ncbi:MAG: hypothetical protein NTV34_14475 [Proteobacteria bacterium]|nr:hypothetical protein [Pseudomonadota bacterium]